MNTPVITTKGTNSSTRAMAILCAIGTLGLALIFYFFIQDQIDGYPKYAQEIYLDRISGVIFFMVIICVGCLIGTAQTFMCCKSYAEVYEDRIIGAGIQNSFKLVSFNMGFDKVTNVTYRGASLTIHTVSGKFTIYTDGQTAKRIVDYFGGRI